MNADSLQLVKPTIMPPVTGLNSVRAAALRQTSVRFRRSEEQDIGDFQRNLIRINQLKRQVQLAELEPDPEPCLLTRVWSRFQELLGNR